MNLRLLQLGDSALPIGGYSHSWGLEAANEHGLVTSAQTLESWSRRWLRHSVGPMEGVVVAAVCRAVREQNWPQALEANDLLWAGLAPPTLRHASRDMGEQLLALAERWEWAMETVAALRRLTSQPWHHAPVFAALAATAGGNPEEATAVYLHQAVTGVISAGVKAVPIGHTHGQQILTLLHPDIQALAGELANRELDSAGSSCPAYEVLCDEQSRLYTRLFRS
jgi:urease accessory protein